MPPQGLYLNRVWYEGEIGSMMAGPADAFPAENDLFVHKLVL